MNVNVQELKTQFYMGDMTKKEIISNILKTCQWDIEVGILVYIASLYHVDTRDIIDCEKKGDYYKARMMYWSTLYYLMGLSTIDISNKTGVNSATIKNGIDNFMDRIDLYPNEKAKWIEIKKFINLLKERN